MDVEDEDEVDEHLLLLRLPRRPVTEGDGTDDDIALNSHLFYITKYTFLRILLTSKSTLFIFRTGLNV